MIESLKLIFVITVIILLIKRKWKLGYILLLASMLLGALFELNPLEIGKNFIFGLTHYTTLKLVGIVVGVYILSGILRRTGHLENLVDSLQQLIKDYRLILAFIPALLGMIPMPAGAMFSAPMVKAVGDRADLTPEEITFVNYWFRHVWELAWPLFPGMILLVSLLKVEIEQVMIILFPFSIIAIIIGFIWMFTNLKRKNYAINKNNVYHNLKKFLLSVWPILTVIILVTVVKIDLLFSLAIVILSLFLINFNKLNFSVIKKIIKNDIDLTVIILVASIMIFQRMLQVSGAIEIIPEIFTKLGVHPFFALFFIPFFISIITGTSLSSIGIGLPILLPIIIQNEANLYFAMIAYVGAYTGMMLSPVHLCLVVTRNYFKADLIKIYKMLILPLSSIVLSASMVMLIKG